jgi:hypothetical protein
MDWIIGILIAFIIGSIVFYYGWKGMEELRKRQ